MEIRLTSDADSQEIKKRRVGLSNAAQNEKVLHKSSGGLVGRVHSYLHWNAKKRATRSGIRTNLRSSSVGGVARTEQTTKYRWTGRSAGNNTFARPGIYL